MRTERQIACCQGGAALIVAMVLLELAPFFEGLAQQLCVRHLNR